MAKYIKIERKINYLIGGDNMISLNLDISFEFMKGNGVCNINLVFVHVEIRL